jgi:hypothetical protein
MLTSPRKTEAYGLSLAPSSRLREEGKGMKDAGERTNVDPPLSGPFLNRGDDSGRWRHRQWMCRPYGPEEKPLRLAM